MYMYLYMTQNQSHVWGGKAGNARGKISRVVDTCRCVYQMRCGLLPVPSYFMVHTQDHVVLDHNLSLLCTHGMAPAITHKAFGTHPLGVHPT